VTSALLDRLSRLFTTVLAALEGERGVWVVGGAVRDLLLEREPRELDLVVEGDAVPVARRAAARLGGDVLVHDRFGTATVRGAGVAFDLAGARRETYARPGALPDVELGARLEEDLARRDFTVNTLALRLVDGARTGWRGAEDDLAARVLRVLHDDSFRDDPTRLLRMARYAARLGFAPEPRTAELAAAAVAEGAPATVTGERVGAELRLLAREPQPAALQELGRFGLGAALLPAFDVDGPLIERALAVCHEALGGAGGDRSGAERRQGGAGSRECETGGSEARTGGNEGGAGGDPDGAGGEASPRADLVALGAAVHRAEPAELAARLRELAFPAADAAAIVACAGLDALVAELTGNPPSASDLILRRRPPEAAALAAAAGSEPARDWLVRGRHQRLAITGNDLLAAGLSGPAIGRALQAARAALLDGTAPDRDTQLAAALAQT
jgi:tRNA nucleotidyltransferase (CCA-adding enzyme)